MIKIKVKEIISEIERFWKERKKGLVIPCKGVIDTDTGAKDRIAFNNFDQIRGANKLIRILAAESKQVRDLFYEAETEKKPGE